MRLCRILLGLLLPLGGFAAVRIKPKSPPTELHSLEKFRGALLQQWCHPTYPPELKKGGTREFVRVRYIVDETGAVTSPEALGGDERFVPAALATVRQWHYQPEMMDGELVPVSFEVNLEFRPNGPPPGESSFYPPYEIQHSDLSPPEELRAPDPVYPKHLEKRLLFGEAELHLSVNKQGRVDGVEVLRSSHADFLAAAFAAVERWEFQPARYGRVPAPGEQLAVLRFNVVDEETNAVAKEGWLEKNGITVRDARDSRSADFFTRIPEAVIMADPVYPHAQLTGGVEGTAQIYFSVNEEGRVNSVRVAEAADPDFGASLAAAISAWRFKPLYHNGEVAAVDFAMQWKFSRPTGADTDPESLAALHPDAPRAKARELDRPLFPLYRRTPHYPDALFDAKTTGAAEIEVTINKSGRVCWPRIVSATQPEFGWAAATAVSQWYFETPMKGGQPVAVRVVIPVRFTTE